MRQRGFTLFEVLLVLVIVSLGVSLAAPRLFATYESLVRRTEERQYRELLRFAGFRAFFAETALEVTAKGRDVSLVRADQVLWTGRYRFFDPPQEPVRYEGTGSAQGAGDDRSTKP